MNQEEKNTSEPGKNNQLPVRNLEDKFSILLLNTVEPCMLVDLNLTIISFNQLLKEQYALYFGKEIRKQESVLNYIQTTSQQQTSKLYEEVFQGHHRTVKVSVGDEQSRRSFLILYTPALDEDEKITGAFVTLKDITEKIKIDRQIVASENRFKAFIERVSDAFIAFDKDLRYTYINQTASRMIQRDPESLIGKYIWDVLPEAVGSPTYLALEKSMNEQVYVVNTDYFAPLDLFYENHFYPSSDGLSLFIRDVSKERRAEKRLQSSERNLRTIFENTREAFTLLDRDCRILAFNSHANENNLLTDSDVEIEIGHDINEYIHESRKEQFRAVINKVLNGATIRYDIDYKTKDGGVLWFEALLTPVLENDTVMGICVARTDITERKLLEERLKKSHDLLIKLTDKLPLAVYQFDMDESGHITFPFTSRAMQRLLPSDAELLKQNGQPIFDTVHRHDLESLLQSIEVSRRNLTICEHEFRSVINGELRWIKGSSRPEKKKNGSVTWYGYLQDITENKFSEVLMNTLNENLEKRAAELARSNAELEQFAYIASHDLQEPLRMVTGFLTQLENKYKDQLDDKAKQYIHFATDGAVRMRKIILDLLEYSRVGRKSDTTESVDTNEMVNEVIDINAALLEEKNATVVFDKLPVIKGNYASLLQVFQNLVGNALKYQPVNAKPEIKIQGEELTMHWQFSVNDNGIGIDPIFFDKIFIVFQRLHHRNDYSGTGIGLAICKKIVENHGGKIWVESFPTRGSTFYFTITK